MGLHNFLSGVLEAGAAGFQGVQHENLNRDPQWPLDM